MNGIDFYRSAQTQDNLLIKIAQDDEIGNRMMANEYADFKEFLMDEYMDYEEFKECYAKFLKWKGYSKKDVKVIMKDDFSV